MYTFGKHQIINEAVTYSRAPNSVMHGLTYQVLVRSQALTTVRSQALTTVRSQALTTVRSQAILVLIIMTVAKKGTQLSINSPCLLLKRTQYILSETTMAITECGK